MRAVTAMLGYEPNKWRGERFQQATCMNCSPVRWPKLKKRARLGCIHALKPRISCGSDQGQQCGP